MGAIEAPPTVEEGTTGTIEVIAPKSDWIRVVDSRTGHTFRVRVGDDKRARFELPSTSVAGATLIVTDDDDPRYGAFILVTPASSV